MEGNTFHTTMAKQSSAITQPVGLVARGRMACMATGHVGGGGLAVLPTNPAVLPTNPAVLPTPASTLDEGFSEKFWLQGCRLWGIYLAVIGI